MFLNCLFRLWLLGAFVAILVCFVVRRRWQFGHSTVLLLGLFFSRILIIVGFVLPC